MQRKLLVFFSILLLCLLLLPTFTFAHSGRTDTNGGHWRRDSKGNKIPGSYHHHNGGSSSSSSGSVSMYDYSSSTGTSAYNSSANQNTKTYPKSAEVSWPISSNLYVGDRLQLNYSFLPSYADASILFFFSSNPSVVNVSYTGLIEAKKPGKATIYICAQNNTALDSCDFNVSAIPSDIVDDTSITVIIEIEDKEYFVGDILSYKVHIIPNDIYNTYRPEYSDPTSIKVLEDYSLELLKAGDFTITVFIGNGQSTSATVNIKEKLVYLTPSNTYEYPPNIQYSMNNVK